MLPVRPQQMVSMQTRDGVRLDADVYYPDAEGPFPVLLMRQPYGRAIASTVVYAHPLWYAAHGYIVVIQDVRGRGTSEGNFQLFAHEIADGEDAVNWAAALPGSNGQVGMYGFSYQGMTQLYAAIHRPAALKVLCPAMVGYDLYTDWAYEGGAFCLQANLGWAIQLATETARLRGDAVAYRELLLAGRNLPLTDPIPARPQIMKDLAPDSFYHDWLDHPEPGAYWEHLSPKTYFHPGDSRPAPDLPMLHIGGWFDTFLRGTLHLYRDRVAHSACLHHLVVGPWPHLPWNRRVGSVDYGPEAISQIDHLQIRWFDHFLKGIDTGLLSEPPVSLFEMGSNHWRSFDAWPGDRWQDWWLQSTGLATIDERVGHLIAAETPPLASAPIPDALVHDPWRPVPASGGHAVIPAGSFERSALDCRTDVLTYTTEPLAANLHLAGTTIVEAHCTADAPSFDLCAVLSEVWPDGRVFNLAQGYRRVAVGAEQPIAIELQTVCALIPAGHALRLSLSAACFPAYPVNPGNGQTANTAALMESQIMTLSIHTGGQARSRLRLPIAG